MESVSPFSEKGFEHWKEGGIWLLYTLFGGLLPIWGGVILLYLFSIPLKISYFLDNGELAIYSAAIISPTLYLVLKDFKTSIFSGRPIFGFVSFAVLVISTLLFTGVTAASAGQININQVFLRKCTIYLYICTVVLAFFIVIIDKIRSTKDIGLYRAKELETFRKKFGETGDEE